MLRYSADARSFAFMLLTTFLLFFLWKNGSELSTPVFILLYGLQLLMAVVVSVMVHNHQHLAMWKHKWLNVATDNWLTAFYGFPIFAWIPTHNSNHHVHVNKEPDYTRTYQRTEKNNLITLLSYPSLSGMKQQGPVFQYMKSLWGQNRRKFWFHFLQVISLLAFIIIALAIDWRKAIWYVIIPQQVSTFSVLIFNYVQHIHADEESEFNHSRNITGPVLNFILLNNGYHTAHHISPGIHWSQLKEKHEAIAGKIDPRLNERSFLWFLFRTYILGAFIPSCRTQNMRFERMQGSEAKRVENVGMTSFKTAISAAFSPQKIHYKNKDV
ncbi:MAG: fatty acid desaturase [Saprospiraceae bacterium]|nr:fatty acid desaturase [Saprospiraceae bacterium]